jgi:F-type H+-transporting ATPase subunit delta
MAELATIARPYAEALFKSAGNDLSGTAQWLDALAAVASQPQLLQFAENPKVGNQQVYDVVCDVVRVQLPPHAQNFLRTVIDNGRLAVLPEIAAQFQSLVDARTGVSQATIESAFPIDASQVAEVKAAMEKRFGRKLETSVVVVPELIGGVRVIVGDEVLDTSIRARLEQMKAALSAA